MAGALLGALPALPLHEAGKYVAGAYVVAFVLVLVYVAIMAVRLSHIQRELGELLSHERSAAGDAQDSAPASSPLP
jgi:CcmD family protein